MMTTYTVREGRTLRHEGIPAPEALREAVWIDLLNPSPEEEKAVQAALCLEIPTREEMQEIESSSRLYKEDEALFLTANFLYGVDEGSTAPPPSPSCWPSTTSSRCATPRPRPSRCSPPACCAPPPSSPAPTA
ncbi:hypothetical protein [Teichococcus aestuarii]|uniref:hypothetical protein n=1 Tax=Teichococcus aestuarii TaxID=568898 RepID=UPI00361D4F19